MHEFVSPGASSSTCEPVLFFDLAEQGVFSKGCICVIPVACDLQTSAGYDCFDMSFSDGGGILVLSPDEACWCAEKENTAIRALLGAGVSSQESILDSGADRSALPPTALVMWEFRSLSVNILP